LGTDALVKLIKEKDDEQAKVEKDFSELVEGLQASYKEISKTKDDALEAVKKSGLGLMKAVMANMGGGDKKDEL